MRQTTDICIIGGGPAGSLLAVRLAQLGHDVCLVERATFPRPHLGESLSPGVLPLLASVGLHPALAAAGFAPVRSVSVNWDQGPQRREDPAARGLLVDRGHFDRLLLDHARALGVRVFQPAMVVARALQDDTWNLRLKTTAGAVELRAALLADATGRAALLRSHRRPTACRTVALHACWRGRNLPSEPRIEAGASEWYWGVPLPQNVYNTLVFMDAARFRADRARLLTTGFRALIQCSGLLAGCPGARLVGRVYAADATPYRDEECITSRSLKVGDAALALDPLSSSGVQKAIQTALSGAVVVNTLLRKPERSEAAQRFYRDRLRTASEQHRQWAAAQYATVAARRPDSFWTDRAAASPVPASEPALPDLPATAPLVVSPNVSYVDLPCLADAFVQVRTAVQHPALGEPVAYLGDCELAPLLQQVRPGLTMDQIALAWSPALSLAHGRALARWLIRHGILVPPAAAQPGGPAPGRLAA